MNNLEEKRSHYPRVSEIISKQNINELRSVSPEVLANACMRGQKIHDYCTAWFLNLWIDEIEPEYQPYFDAFKEWAAKYVDDCIHSEVRLYDDEKIFTGKFDMIVKMKTGKLVLMDIKTSHNKSKAWPVQLAAYGHLCNLNGYKFDAVMNLHLKKTHAALYEVNEGKKVMTSPPQIKACTLNEHEDLTLHWDIFSSALKCYDYFDRKEVK